MDTEQIKKAAKVAGGMAYYPPQPYEEDRRYSDAEIAWLEFVNQASPVVVSELIAENERNAKNSKEWEEASLYWMAERDKLAAELECARGDLKTAMEIVERNQKDAERYRWIKKEGYGIGSYHSGNGDPWFEDLAEESIDEEIARENS